MTSPYVTLQPADIEVVAVAYFKDLIAPTPVGDRVPDPNNPDDTINAFLRVEAGGGTLVEDSWSFDLDVIIHAYAPTDGPAAALIGKAIAYGSNATGNYVTAQGHDWYIEWSRPSGLATKQADPIVKLTRYRAMLTWRIPGKVLS